MPDFTEKLEELHRTPCVGDEVIVVCHRCGYPWKTSSKLEIVSCPSCRVGTRRIKEEK